jgi:hypothetical protein
MLKKRVRFLQRLHRVVAGIRENVMGMTQLS